jgi:hypothetical protein
MFFAELPCFSLGMLLTDSLRPSCGAKNDDRLWQTFILHCLFPFFLSFWCNSKWKRAFESLELSKFRDWRCVRIMQLIFGFCKRALFLNVHETQELASCSTSHYYNCFSLDLPCFGETENSRMNFPCSKNQRSSLFSPARSRQIPEVRASFQANPKPQLSFLLCRCIVKTNFQIKIYS